MQLPLVVSLVTREKSAPSPPLPSWGSCRLWRGTLSLCSRLNRPRCLAQAALQTACSQGPSPSSLPSFRHSPTALCLPSKLRHQKLQVTLKVSLQYQCRGDGENHLPHLCSSAVLYTPQWFYTYRRAYSNRITWLACLCAYIHIWISSCAYPSNHCSLNQFLAQIAAILTLPVTEVLHFVLVHWTAGSIYKLWFFWVFHISKMLQ